MKEIKLMDPRKNHQKTAAMLKNGSQYTTLAVALTTGVSVFIWGNDLASQYVPEWIAWKKAICFAVGAAMAIGAGWLTDIGFGTVLQRVLFAWMAKGHPNLIKWNVSPFFQRMQRIEMIGLTALLISLLAIDVTTSYVIRDPVAERAGSKPIINVDSLRNDLANQLNSELAQLRELSKEKAQEIRNKEASVKRGNAKLLELQKDGNQWAAGQISRKVANATKADEKVRQETELGMVERRRTGDTYIQERVSEAERLNAENMMENKSRQGIAAIIYLIFTIGLKLLTILLRVMVVISFLAYSYQYSPDLNGDGVIDYKDLDKYGSEPDFQKARPT